MRSNRHDEFARLSAFTTSTEARPALLGFLGAAMITAGGVGAGSTRLHDPLLESMHLSWLRFGHGLVLSSVLLWGGVAVMLFAWLWLGRYVIDGSAREYTMVATTGFWLAPLLLSVPVFSRDTYSYLAQGALLRDGFDPYAVGPVDNPNSLLDNVSPIWTTTTAPYGPAFILVAKFVTHAGRRPRDRRHDGAAAVHAARTGAADLGCAPAGPARRRQRRCGAVDLRAQPVGDHPSDGRRSQRDADGRHDGGRHRADIRPPPRRGQCADRGGGGGEGHRGDCASVHGVGVGAPAARQPGLRRRCGHSRLPPRDRSRSSWACSPCCPGWPVSVWAGSPPWPVR